MRVLLLADGDFATRERTLVERLAFGMMDEGVRAILATPRDAVGDEEGLIERIWHDAPATRFGAARAASALSARLAAYGLADERAPLDVVHALGAGVWRIGARLARIHSAPLVLECWTSALVRQGMTFARSGAAGGTPGVVVQAPSVALAHGETIAAGVTIEACPWGVHARDEEGAGASDAPETPETPETPGVVIIADRSVGTKLISVLRGVSGVVEARDAMLVCDAALFQRDRRIWRAARDFGMLPRLSLVAALEARRAPALGADALLWVSRPGEHRSIILDAMASGVAVAAPADPRCDWTGVPGAMRTLKTGAEDEWREAVGELLEDAAARRSIGDAARNWARSERSASGHVAAQIALYERVVGRRAVGVGTR